MDIDMVDSSLDSCDKIDMSIIGEEENYNGMNKEDNEDFNFAAAVALRKNLAETFDKQISGDQQPPVKRLKAETSRDVKAMVAAFEKGSTRSLQTIQTTSSSYSKPPITRPGTTPSSLSRNKTKNLMQVYLRIRPPVSNSELKSDDSHANTIEILPSTHECDEEVEKVRTYPPEKSNAAKVVRGQHHLHNSTHNIDSTFRRKRSGDGEEFVKGVKEYTFNKVFGPDNSQEDIYNGVAAPLVEGLFPPDNANMVGDNAIGRSSLLFAYGITNAGKTHTILGSSSRKSNMQASRGQVTANEGIIPRSLSHIITKIKEIESLSKNQNSTTQMYALRMSYFEIYNEQIYDLLPKNEAEKGSSNTLGGKALHSSKHFRNLNQPLRIREGHKGRIIVRGLNKTRVKNLTHGLDLIQKAMQKRRTSSNNINDKSSRSHCVCQFEVVSVPNNVHCTDNQSISSGTVSSTYSSEDENARALREENTARMWIVDLAGSERSKRTGAMTRSSRQKEAALINSSLMKLMRCLQTMQNNQCPSSTSSIIPFRESKLTHIFMDHLTGPSASRTTMVVNVNPSVSDFDETQHVLAYATVARSVKISEEEYLRKRQSIQLNNFHENRLDDTSENLENNSTKTSKSSPPRKVIKFAKKLSPRALLKKRREQQAKKRKAELLRLRATKNAKENESKTANKSKFPSNDKIDKSNVEQSRLRTDLATLAEENKRLKTETIALRQQLENKEAEIRLELADEVEEQFNYMRQKHLADIERLKIRNKIVPSPSKSTKKLQREKAEEIIQDLIDKNEECEEEMVRMRDSHRNEILTLKQQHQHIIQEKNDYIESLESQNELHLNEKEDIRFELEEMKMKHLATDESTDDNDSDVENEHPEEERDTIFSTDTGKSPGHMRRLPRGRCSEVACANMSSPNLVNVSSSTKKKGLRIGRPKSKASPKSPMRSPFSKIQNSQTKKVQESLITSLEKENELAELQ